MTKRFFLLVVKDIILNPVKTWETIDSENRPANAVRNDFLLPLILLVSISTTTGSLIFTNNELSPFYSILIGIKCFMVLYITTYVSTYILREITYPLDLGRSFDASFRLIVYSLVPLLLCQIFSRLFESLLFVNVLALFGLCIFQSGAERLLTPSSYKKTPLIIAAFLTYSGVYFATDLFFTKMTDKILYTFFT